MFIRILFGCSAAVFCLLIGFACCTAWADTNLQAIAEASEIGEGSGHLESTHGDAGQEAAQSHHDPYDLTHANASEKMEQPEEWRYDMAICTFAVFLLLLALLTVFAWKPITDGLDKREKSIAARIDQAERTAEQAAEQLRQYEAKLAAAADEAAQLIEQARRDAEAVADKVRAEAQENAVRQRQRAVADIREAKNAALGEISREAANLAVRLAGKIVRRELTTDDHQRLIAEAMEQLPSNN